MLKYYINRGGRSKEISLEDIQVLFPILLECTTWEEAYIKNEKHYVMGRLDEFDFKNYADLIKKYDLMWD